MYRWIDHTAELGLEIEAAREEDVFREAAAAYRELVQTGEDGEPVIREIGLNGIDRADLLAQWLDELVYLADAEGFVPDRVTELSVWEDALRATLAGRRGAPRPLVKAVTYHGLRFEHEGGRWIAYVVLDV